MMTKINHRPTGHGDTGGWKTRLLGLLLLLMAGTQLTLAQDRTVTGTVTDATGDPLIGVTVTLVGKDNRNAITDLSGKYSIRVPQKGVLKFSYVGYKTKAVNLTPKATLDVTLDEDNTLVSEVVVTAMDMRRDERSLSTAFQKVNMEGMDETRSGNFLENLQGKIAGVQIQSNGAAGSASVVIRGMNSLTGNNQPLYVIDGVPIVNEVNTGEISTDYGNAAASLNPDDIESMTVLKGANAAALYGSDAANGAIIITTKKAKNQKGIGVTYSTNLQFQHIYQYPSYQNVYGGGEAGIGLKKETFNYGENNRAAYDYTLPYGISRLAEQNQRSWGMPMLGYTVIGRNGEMKTYSPANSLLDLFETSTAWTNNVSIEKASELASVRFSYTHLNSDDVMDKQNQLTRHIMNLRAVVKPLKWLDIETTVRYTNENVKNRNYRNSTKQNPMYDAAWMPRDMEYQEMTPWKRSDGTLFGYNSGGFVNPLWAINEQSNEDTRQWWFGNLSFNFKITNDLSFRVKGAIDNNNRTGYEFINMYDPSLSGTDGMYKEFQETARNLTYEGLLQYSHRWKHLNLQAGLGAQAQDYQWKKITGQIQTLLVTDWKSLSNNGATQETWGDYSAKKKQAIFSTVSLGYNDWAYLDLTGRNDWSSALPSDNRSYFYTSAGVSFILTQAIKTIDPRILSFAKVRASYANVGNDTGFDQIRNGLKYGGVILGNMTYFESDSRKMNENLKPERTTSYELGADLRFMNNRIGIDFTYYNKTTRDEILASQVSTASGYTNAMFNAGKVKNWGYEVAITATPVKVGGFSWETQLNWAQNKSEVVELVGDMDRMQLSQSEGTIQFYIEKGRSLGTLYAKMAKRDENGNILVNQQGNALNEADQFLCDVSPKWNGGWRNTFRYKRLSASVLIDFRHGGKLWSATQHQGTRDGQTIASLAGRDETLFSFLILGENGEERSGWHQTNHTVNPDATQSATDATGVLVLYGDRFRPKGLLYPGVYDESVTLLAGQPNFSWREAASYWMNTDANALNFLYSASYIKLRELSIGYDLPQSVLRSLGGFCKSAKVSFVGRNLAILHKDTPNGIDPESASSLGVIQGMEKGNSLPMASYGFDFKVTF